MTEGTWKLLILRGMFQQCCSGKRLEPVTLSTNIIIGLIVLIRGKIIRNVIQCMALRVFLFWIVPTNILSFTATIFFFLLYYANEVATSLRQHLPHVYWINLDNSEARRNSILKSMKSSEIVDEHRVAACGRSERARARGGLVLVAGASLAPVDKSQSANAYLCSGLYMSIAIAILYEYPISRLRRVFFASGVGSSATERGVVLIPDLNILLRGRTVMNKEERLALKDAADQIVTECLRPLNEFMPSNRKTGSTMCGMGKRIGDYKVRIKNAKNLSESYNKRVRCS